MDHDLARFLLRLYDLGAIQIAPPGQGFRFKHHDAEPDAPLSPIKFNLRSPFGSSDGKLGDEEFTGIAGFLAQHVLDHNIPCGAVTGIPRAGEPLASAFCKEIDQARSPYLVKLHKVQGVGSRQIDGVESANAYPCGKVVLPIDDVATRANTKLEAVTALRDFGFVVTDCLVFIGYGPRPMKELQKADVALHAVTTAALVIEVLRGNDRINYTDYGRVHTWLQGEDQLLAA